MTKWGAAVAIAIALTAGCSSSSTPSSVAEHTAGSPKAALTALLADEQRGDHAASFARLSDESRTKYRDADGWTRLREQLPSIADFDITAVHGDSVVAVVRHEPGLDPFVGLSPARTTETWRARAEHGTWRFDGEPRVELLLPPRARAVTSARAWADAVQSCNRTQALDLQAVTRVFGHSRGADQLCHAMGTLHVTTTELPGGPQTADLVAQYTSDALTWAQAVRIEGGPTPFSAVLAPIGDDWKVVAVFDAE